MSTNTDNLLRSTIQGIFGSDEKEIQPKVQIKTRGGQGPDKRDLELAMTILLVDLAAADQDFDPQEYHVITSGLRRLFGTTKSEVTALVNQANVALSNLRGVGKFADLLKQNLDDEQRVAIMEVIEQVIHADGEEDGFETYLRHKLAGMLGIELEPATAQTDSQ